METTLALPDPDSITTILDILQYAWLAGIWWAKGILERLKVLEDKQAITPTLLEVEGRMEKELSKVAVRLDKIEALILGMIQKDVDYRFRKPDVNL